MFKVLTILTYVFVLSIVNCNVTQGEQFLRPGNFQVYFLVNFIYLFLVLGLLIRKISISFQWTAIGLNGVCGQIVINLVEEGRS